MERYRRPRNKGDKKWFGFALLAVGLFILLRRFDLFFFEWHTMWPWILIVIGTAIGVKSKFRNNASWVLILIGVFHLVPVFTIFGVTSTALALPGLLIAIGLLIIFNPSKKKFGSRRCEDKIKTFTNNSSELDVDVTFGGHKELITSKSFRGGRISSTFGGVEINMMNADTSEKYINLNLDITFSGAELIVPSHWIIQNNIDTTLAGVEDKRSVVTQPNAENTITLVLAGSCTFGSIEIKSY